MGKVFKKKTSKVKLTVGRRDEGKRSQCPRLVVTETIREWCLSGAVEFKWHRVVEAKFVPLGRKHNQILARLGTIQEPFRALNSTTS